MRWSLSEDVMTQGVVVDRMDEPDGCDAHGGSRCGGPGPVRRIFVRHHVRGDLDAA